MTISDMGFWSLSKLFISLVFKSNESVTDSDQLLKLLDENGVKDIKVVGRGGVEVSIRELKNSSQFKELEAYARLKIEKDKQEAVTEEKGATVD